jgi:hypothetical protein
MATVRLAVAETRENALPPVCAHCGLPASTFRAQDFVWIPRSFWVVVPILGQFSGFAAAGSRKQMRVWMPICAGCGSRGVLADRRNARRIALVFLASILLFGLGLAVRFVLLQTGRVDHKQADKIIFPSFLGASVFCLVSMGVVIWIGQRAIVRSTQITEDSITLTGVSERFVQAVVERRGGRG